jgi:hypothetical protein
MSMASPVPGTWANAGIMTVPRAEVDASVALADGRVLRVGVDRREGGAVPIAELWDPATNSWSPTQPLNAYRAEFALVPLHDGRALVAGGLTEDGVSYSSAYVFDPNAGSWSKVGFLSMARAAPSAALLPDGRVLVAGGYYRDKNSAGVDPAVVLAGYHEPPLDELRLGDDVPEPSGNALATAELFDPRTGEWSAAGSMRYARTGAEAAVLSDGRVLLVGSEQHYVNRLDARAYSNAEIYDPATDRFTLAGELPDFDRVALQGLAGPNGWPIPDEPPEPQRAGQLVAVDGGGAVLIGHWWWWKHVGDISRSFRYGSATGEWTEIGETFICIGEGPGDESRSWCVIGVRDLTHAAVAALPDGRVLVAGGHDAMQRLDVCCYGPPTSAVDAYDARRNAWATLAPLPAPRADARALSLPDGSVLVLGGYFDTLVDCGNGDGFMCSNKTFLGTAVRIFPTS